MAFKDVQRCATLEPKNKTFLETLRRLGAEIQAKVRIENTQWPTLFRTGVLIFVKPLNSQQLKTTFSTDSRVQNMFDILLDSEMGKENKEKVSGLPLSIDRKIQC